MFSSIARRVAPVGAAAVLLLANGCAQLPAVLGTPAFQAATLAAPDAWSFTDVTFRPSVQQALYARDVLNLYTDQTAAGRSLNQLPSLSGAPLSLENDVLPHLDGEVAYAVSGPPEQVLAVLLVHTDDADAMLHLLNGDATTKFTKDARGATRYTNGTVMAAGYKHWAVYATDADTLTQTLDRIDGKGGQSLAAQARYQSAVDRLTGDRIGYGYLDITPLLSSAAFKDLPASTVAMARGRLAYSLAFGAGPQGSNMRALDLRTEYIAESPARRSAVDRGDALLAMDQLPVGNAIAISGASIGQVADSLATLSSDFVPDDALNLLDAFAGPYALGVSPVTGAGQDTSAFLASLSFLGQLAPDTDINDVRDLVAAAVDTTGTSGDMWQQEVVPAGDWTAINLVPAPLELDQEQQQVLASDKLYQSVRPALSQDGSNVYINIGALVAWAQQQGATSDQIAAFGQVQAMGTSWRGEPRGDGHGRLLLIVGS